MAFNWYDRDIAHMHEGMIADTTLRVVDSYGAESDIAVGQLVLRGTEEGTVKVVSTVADVANIVGIAVHEHKEPEVPMFKTGDTVPVMTFGDVAVKVADAVTAGAVAAVKEQDGKFVFCASNGSGTTEVASAHYLYSADADNMTVLRIRK